MHWAIVFNANHSLDGPPDARWSKMQNGTFLKFHQKKKNKFISLSFQKIRNMEYFEEKKNQPFNIRMESVCY